LQFKGEVARRLGAEPTVALPPALGAATMSEAAATPTLTAATATAAPMTFGDRSARSLLMLRTPTLGWPWRGDRSAAPAADGASAASGSVAAGRSVGLGRRLSLVTSSPATAPAITSASGAGEGGGASASTLGLAAAAGGLPLAPPPLQPQPTVTSETYSAIADETVAHFLLLARPANDALYASRWRPVKKQPQIGLVLERKALTAAAVVVPGGDAGARAGAGAPTELVRATVQVACPPERAFAALRGPRYRSVAHPDLLTCDSLVVYDDNTALRHYRFQGSLLPDRDVVTLDVARAVGPRAWAVVQRSVAAADLVPRTGAMRLVAHIAGYYIVPADSSASRPSNGAERDGAHDSTSNSGGSGGCIITHVLQLSSESSTYALAWLRYGWAWNLTTVKYALERSVDGADAGSAAAAGTGTSTGGGGGGGGGGESAAAPGLPHVATSKLIEVTVPAGGLVWIAVPHQRGGGIGPGAGAGPLPSAATAAPRLGHLAWEFSTRGEAVKFSVVFANNEAPQPASALSALGGGPNTSTAVVAALARPRPPVLLTAAGAEVILPSHMVQLSARGAADQPAPWEGAGRVWAVLPPAVFNSHICPVTGSVLLPPADAGTFYLVFDNREARFSDCHVVYKAAITYAQSSAAAADLVSDLADDDEPPPSSLPLDPPREPPTPMSAPALTSSVTGATPLATAAPASPATLNAGKAPRPLPLGGAAGARRGTGRTGELSALLLLPPPLEASITADVRVGRGEVCRVPLYLFTPAEELRLVWQFRSGKDEVDFSIVYEEWSPALAAANAAGRSNGSARPAPAVRTLLEPGRVTTEAEAFAGELRVPGRPGRYSFVWDNSFSRWRGKMVGFSVLAVPTAGPGPSRTPSTNGRARRGGRGGGSVTTHA
jgi:hypothetical protein